MFDTTAEVELGRPGPAGSWRAEEVTAQPSGAVRRLALPRPVLVDPQRVWVAARGLPARVMGPTLRKRAENLDARFKGEWIPARQFAWARLRLGQEVVGMPRSGSTSTPGSLEVALRQWMPYNSIGLPPQTTVGSC